MAKIARFDPEVVEITHQHELQREKDTSFAAGLLMGLDMLVELADQGGSLEDAVTALNRKLTTIAQGKQDGSD